MKKIVLFVVSLFYLSLAKSQTFSIGNLPNSNYSGGVTGVWDMNNDGLNDIVVMNQSTTLKVLYQQLNGTFIESQIATGPLSTSQWGMTVGDINNDGFGDVLCGGYYEGAHIYYSDSNGAYSVSLSNPPSIFMQACLFGDFDNDGWLDAFACHDDGPAFMWRNDGSGILISDQTIIDYNLYPGVYPGTSDPLMSGNYGNEFCDFDRDRDMDLLVAKCRQASNDPYDVRRTNLLFVNDGNNNYSDDAHNRGLVNLQQTWTATFGDIDNDGDFDCFMTTHSGTLEMYENNGLGYFTNITSGSGLEVSGFFMQGQMADFDNDGYLDIIHAGGNFGYYHNNGDKTFTQMSSLFQNPSTMHGFALGDLNNDGFIDVYANYGDPNGYVTPGNNPDRLWLTQPNSNNWIGFDLEGVISNKNAVGTLVEIHGDFGTQIREVRSGVSYGITNSNMLLFGIGASTSIDYAVIYWPAGGIEVVESPGINGYHQIFESNCITSAEASIISNGGTTLCQGSSIDLSISTVNSNFIWSNGETTSSINVSSSGNYYVVAYDNFGCASQSNTISISVENYEIPTISVDGDLEFCQGDSVLFTATNAQNYLWSNGLQTQEIYVSTAGIYSVQIDNGCGLTEASVPVSIETWAAPQANVADVFLASAGQVTLSANGGSNVNWYGDQSSVTPIYSGAEFTTNVLNTTEFWYDNTTIYPGITGSGAKDAQDQINGQFSNSLYYLTFDAIEDFTLDSVLVYAQSAGERTIELVNSTGAVINSVTITIPSGSSYVNLNFFVPVGFNYGLRPSPNSNPGLWRDGSGSTQNYPYDVSGVASITNTTIVGSTSQNFYYFFYDWHVHTADNACTSQRNMATVFVGNSIEEGNLISSSILAYPNPGSDCIYIRRFGSDFNDETAQVCLYDISGRLVQSNLLQSDQSSINVEEITSGLYLIKVIQDDRVFMCTWTKN